MEKSVTKHLKEKEKRLKHLRFILFAILSLIGISVFALVVMQWVFK